MCVPVLVCVSIYELMTFVTNPPHAWHTVLISVARRNSRPKSRNDRIDGAVQLHGRHWLAAGPLLFRRLPVSWASGSDQHA